MHPSDITVIKASGKREPFSEEKVLRSLERAHVPKSLQHEIVTELESSLHSRVSSKDIYDHIKQYLHKKRPLALAKYNLKLGIMQLGPSGYPFERYIGALLEHYGYTCSVSQTVQGKCVAHEVDVVAHKGNDRYIIECKFHNQPGTRSDVKVTLYVKARYDDIVERRQLTEKEQFDSAHHHGWLITNTKCTSDALQYAQCAGITVIGWGYPDHGNLQDMVEDAGLYPITVLTTLSQLQKEELLKQNIVLAKQLTETPDVIEMLHLKDVELNQLNAEVHQLLSHE